MVINYFNESGKSLQEILDDLILVYYYDTIENNA